MNQQTYILQQRFSIPRQELENLMHNSIESAPLLLTPDLNNVQYNIYIFPNGRVPAESGRFLLCLKFTFPENIQIHANYTINVGESAERTFKHLYKSSSSFRSVLCSREFLFSPTPLFVDDELSIDLVGNFTLHFLDQPVFVKKNASNIL